VSRTFPPKFYQYPLFGTMYWKDLAGRRVETTETGFLQSSSEIDVKLSF
jgi:hypothetical protein